MKPAPQFFTLGSLLEQVRVSEGHVVRFHEASTWSAGVLALKGGQHDPQTAHERDELYLVLRGQGALRIGDELHPVAPGDFWFVPAGAEHRFEDYHQELVVFYVLVTPDTSRERREHAR